MSNKLIGQILPLLYLFLTFTISAQVSSSRAVNLQTVFIDDKGIMRWTKDKSEVSLFGVNYTTPFAFAYRAHASLNIPHEKAIAEDVYHMARLGFDAFRVHVWDCEISDSTGNIVDNEHLRLFDYQIKLMKERGMKFLITPIAYWGNGYPEPDQNTPGFSTKYGKEKCLTDPDAIKAQEKYLAQFVNRINRYTGIAYKDDPDIIAFEICNEPHHKGTEDETVNFINRMVSAIKQTGCSKPVFYNISHSIQLADAYFNSKMQGGTFQWYPTNLVHGREIEGNFLPNIDLYDIPFAQNPKFVKMAKVVYEFDAADIARSYIYPYMAKSFREAGFQFATHFAYDPLYLAYSNTEYTTHYMNLAYAPQKAISLKIAGEAFHKVSLGKKAASYPADSVFNGFRVSYKTDLAEMVTNEKFFYTNNTKTIPPAVDKLKYIAGYGNSPVISYEGCGAYFLDKLENGVWRLEIMPDAVWVRDPFEKASLKKEVAVILWKTWPMSVNLPDLGENFSIKAINEGNTISLIADGTKFSIYPGTYLICNNKINSKWKSTDKWNNITLNEFAAPSATCRKTYFNHTPLNEIVAGKPLKVITRVVSSDSIESVDLFAYTKGWRPEKIPMKRTGSYIYSAEIPGNAITEGFLRYYISVKQYNKVTTYPSGIESLPTDWDFYGQPYQTIAVKPTHSVCLFDAASDGDNVLWPGGRYHVKMVPAETSGKTVVKVTVNQLANVDEENKNALPEPDFSFKFFFKKKISQRIQDLQSFHKIVVRGNSLTGKNCIIQIALITDEGDAFGDTITLQPGTKDYTILLKDLKKVRTVNIPGAYPTFLPYYFNNKNSSVRTPDLTKMENLQFSIGPGIPESEYGLERSIAIESVYLE